MICWMQSMGSSSARTRFPFLLPPPPPTFPPRLWLLLPAGTGTMSSNVSSSRECIPAAPPPAANDMEKDNDARVELFVCIVATFASSRCLRSTICKIPSKRFLYSTLVQVARISLLAAMSRQSSSEALPKIDFLSRNICMRSISVSAASGDATAAARS